MRVLLDTHILLWSADEPERLSLKARTLIADPQTVPYFSAVSILEVAIKHAQNKPGFRADPVDLRSMLLDSGYEELVVTSLHAVEVCRLPSIHKDPFDRVLVAQAMVENFTLLTADRLIARYPGPILKV